MMAGGRQAQWRETGEPKPHISVDALSSHPGQRVNRRSIDGRDREWIDIGSGIMSRVFTNATRLHTTSKGGPSMSDVQYRRVWSLTTGKLLDECCIDDVPDRELHRPLREPDDIRVELTLRNAITLFKRKGPDVAEICSQPRVCMEVDKRSFDGETMRPGWSLDLTMNDPRTGRPWDLSDGGSAESGEEIGENDKTILHYWITTMHTILPIAGD